MTVATTSAPTASKFADKLAASSFEFNGESRPLTGEEFNHARFVVRRLDSARGFVAEQFGHADETDEYRAARERYESFEGGDPAYLKAALENRELLAPYELQSYAKYSAELYDPASIERATWMMLRTAEVDAVQFIDALAESAASTSPGVSFDAPVLNLDGRRFTIAFLDEDYDPRDARLIVGPAAGCQGEARGEAGDDRGPSLN